MENRYHFFIKCFLKFTCETIWAWWFLFWKLTCYWFNSAIHVELFRSSIFLCMSLSSLIFQGTDLFHLHNQIFRHRVKVFLCNRLNIQRIRFDSPSFISDIDILIFLVILDWSLPILLIISKKQPLVSHISILFIFLFSITLTSALIFNFFPTQFKLFFL